MVIYDHLVQDSDAHYKIVSISLSILEGYITMSRRGDPGLTSITVLVELLKAGPYGLALGILQDKTKATLGEYLTDGRSRSVKHAIENLEKYGIISEKISSHDERIYSIRLVADDYMSSFLYLLSAVDDLIDEPEGVSDHVIFKSRKDMLELNFTLGLSWKEELDRGIWKFNALEAIEGLLWEEENMNLLLETLRDLEEHQGMVPHNVGSKPPSLLDFMANNVRKVKNLKEFYNWTPIERVFIGLWYIRDSLVHLLSTSYSELSEKEKYIIVTVALFKHFRNIVGLVVLPEWINYKLKNEIPALSERRGSSLLTFILLERAETFPNAVRKKFNIEKIEERQ